MRKILLAVVALSLLAGSTAQAFPFKKKKKKAKTEQTATPPAPKESAFDKQVKGAKHLPGVIGACGVVLHVGRDLFLAVCLGSCYSVFRVYGHVLLAADRAFV